MTSMSQYIRLTKGLVSKGNLIKPEELQDKVTSTEVDWYTSTYYYNEDQYQEFQKTNSVAGVKNVYTDKIWFDFDSKADLELAKQDTIEVINRLTKYNIDKNDLEIYYSGSKGFNVVVNLKVTLTPEKVLGLAMKFAKDLKTFDTSMYDSTQLLRVPYTKHHKSGLYKIPLTLSELKILTIEEIQEKASTLDNVSEMAWGVANPTAAFFEIPIVSKPAKVTPTYSLDLSNKPSQWKNCKWSLMQGNFKESQRHESLMIIGATCRALGYDKETTYYMCKSAIKKQAALTGQIEFPKEELYKNILEQSIFKDNWEGGQYTCKKEGFLKTYCESLGEHGCDDREKEENTIIRMSDIQTKFTEYVKHIEENTILTGIPKLDKVMPLTTGMNLGIVGAASSGKTALALNILKNTSEKGVISVFASLDMHRNRLFEKLLYKTTGLSRDEIFQKFKDGKGDEITAQLKEDYKNVWFYDRSSPTVADIREYILDIQKETGQKVKLVMVDYFERVNSEKGEDTAASKDIAGKLQDLVNDLDVCLVTLVQPNKFSLAGGPDTPITSYTAIKGSSFLYQSFRSIISIWRPFFTPEQKSNDKYLQMAILKNDLGEIDMFNFGWTGKTGDIWELAPEEITEFNNLLAKKKADKAKAESNDGWG